jgi:hypothetical protein
MVDFSQCYESTWIVTSSRDPKFAKLQWNLHNSTKMLLPDSSQHRRRQKAGSNSTIWKFLDCLKAEKNLTDVKLNRRLL